MRGSEREKVRERERQRNMIEHCKLNEYLKDKSDTEWASGRDKLTESERVWKGNPILYCKLNK